MRLPLWSALAFLFMASPALADEPDRATTSPSSRNVIRIMGQIWCLGDTPQGTACDLRLLPPARSQPATPTLREARRWLDDLAAQVRQRPTDRSASSAP
jgi:hypothetical protein